MTKPTTCKRGHPRNAKTAVVRQKVRPKGGFYLMVECRACRSLKAREKYRQDAEFREREHQRCRARHHAIKQEESHHG